jgi:methyl-accepting chemotaxis protein
LQFQEESVDLDNAIQKHAQWKFRFHSAIQTLQTNGTAEAMDVASISKDNCCDFGKWLHSEAKQQFGQSTSYAKCVTGHAEFHSAAGKVAAAVNAHKPTEAMQLMASGSAFAEASKKVGVAIIELKNQIKK